MKYLHKFLALLALISLNLARSVANESSDSGSDNDDDEPAGSPEAKSGYENQGFGYSQQSPQVFFGGQYGGRCDQDGFYFNDENSFIMCNHGIAYAQQCAPGTRNGMASQYKAGGYYTHTAFCDINLVDFGYAAFHSQRGNRGGGYGSSSSTGYKPSSGGYSAPSSYRPLRQTSYHSSGNSMGSGSADGSSYGIYGYNEDSGSRTNSYDRHASSPSYGKPESYSKSQSAASVRHQSYSGEGSHSQNKGYGQSSYNSQSYGGMQHGNQGYGSSRYGGIGLYKTTTSYKQPTYQVIAYRPSYTSYKQQPSYQTSYGQQPQGHSSYGRKYSGYYTQRRYHTQPAMKY